MGYGLDISLAATPPASGAESFPLPTRLDTVPSAPCWLVDRIRGIVDILRALESARPLASAGEARVLSHRCAVDRWETEYWRCKFHRLAIEEGLRP